jgi:hypothetical protein
MANLLNVHGKWVNTEKPGGQVWFVGGGTTAYAGKGASNDNNGLSPQNPLATIAQAVTNATAGRGDTIVLLPGGETITAAIALSKADLTLTGYTVTGPNTRNPSVITCATDSIEMIAIDAPNVTVENLTLDHNTTTANVDLIDIGDATASTDFVLRNLFIDMEGSATNTNGISVSSDTVSSGGLIEGVRIHDYDAVGIEIETGNQWIVIRDCWIYDGVTANQGTHGIANAGDGGLIDNCRIQTDGTAGVQQNGTLNMTTNCNIWSTGANTICILMAASATTSSSGNWLTAVAAGNLCDYTTDNTSPSADANISGIFAATPGAATLDDVTVGG